MASAAWVPLASSPASASPPALQACTANNVEVNAQQLADVHGQSLEAFTLKNTGSSTCGLEGYPDLTFFTSTRLDAHVRVVHRSSVYEPVTPKLLVVVPNGVVSFGLSYHGATPTTTAVAKSCIVESIIIQLPLAPPSSGDFAYHEMFNACQGGNAVAVTPVEGRAVPQRRAT
jgi:hypothetical protein